MARPTKIGLDYFPFDVHFDEQFEALVEIHGNDGFAWLVRFWQKAYRTDDGIVDLSDILGVIGAKTARILPDKQREIISDCIKLKLLYEVSERKYSSKGIQRRLEKVRNDREYDRNRAKKELSDGKLPENCRVPAESKVKESKGKEIKEKKKETIKVPSHLEFVWVDFLIMRKSIRKPATERAQELIIKKLEELAPGNNELQIKIIEQSITKAWQDVFPLNENFKQNNNNNQRQFGRREISNEELIQQAKDRELCNNQPMLPQLDFFKNTSEQK